MIEDLRKLIRATPFMPFTLQMTDGRAFRVPHPDHIFVYPSGLIGVEDDEGVVNLLPSIHLSGIEPRSPAS